MTVANSTHFLPLEGGQTESHIPLVMLIQHMALVLGSMAARASVQSDLWGPQHEAMEDSRCCRPPPIPSLTTHRHTCSCPQAVCGLSSVHGTNGQMVGGEERAECVRQHWSPRCA